MDFAVLGYAILLSAECTTGSVMAIRWVVASKAAACGDERDLTIVLCGVIATVVDGAALDTIRVANLPVQAQIERRCHGRRCRKGSWASACLLSRRRRNATHTRLERSVQTFRSPLVPLLAIAYLAVASGIVSCSDGRGVLELTQWGCR